MVESVCVLSSAGFQKARPRGQGMDQRLPESQDPGSESHGVIKKTKLCTEVACLSQP